MRKEFGKPMATFGQDKDLPNFKATRSLPSPFLRWVTIAVLALFTGLSAVMLHGSIHLAFSEEEDPMAAGVLILLSLAMVVISVALWRYRRYSEITIDETGITYRNAHADSVYRSFSWQDLQTNPDPGGYDIERITIQVMPMAPGSVRITSNGGSQKLLVPGHIGKPSGRPHVQLLFLEPP